MVVRSQKPWLNLLENVFASQVDFNINKILQEDTGIGSCDKF